MEAVDLRRHGDVMIFTKKGFEIPKEVKLKKQTLIHKGTNNSHVISKGQALIGALGEKKFIRVTKAATVSHIGGSSTHKDGALPVGDYWAEIQTFYDHIDEESKQVID